MSWFLAKRKISFSFFSSPYHHHQLALLTPLPRQSISTQSQQVKEVPFIAQYLISSLGFFPERALKVSTNRRFVAIKSEDRPESVVRFFKDTGLSDDQIKTTLKPKVRELKDGGFSGELLVHLILYSSAALLSKNPLSRLLFWRDFVGKGDEALLKILQRNAGLITYDIDKYVVPRIKLLNEYGLSNRDIAGVLASYSNCMRRGLEPLRQVLEFIEELGIQRESSMFKGAFKVVHASSKDKLKGKVDFFMMRYGWSQEEVYYAFRKFPSVLTLSEGNVNLKMDFLTTKGGFKPRSIASQPVLLGYSLERVLIPRHTVLSVLKALGLKKKYSLLTACVISERRFRELYVVPYEKDVLGLREAYAAAYGIKVSV
ncbi:transcription termination factor MTERF8, chloroplastic-like [Carex rostrata]